MGFFNRNRDDNRQEDNQTSSFEQNDSFEKKDNYQDNYQSNYRRNNNYNDNYAGGGNRREPDDEVFSVPVKAGKRIYYFDVKSTRSSDFFVTITESRKKPSRDGGFYVERNKIHLYKEDFIKFAEGLNEVLTYVRENKPEFAEAEARGEYERPFEQRFTNNNDENATADATAVENDTPEKNESENTDSIEKEIFGDL